MKKIALVAIAVILVGAFCYASCGTCAMTEEKVQSVSGKVAKVVVADPVKGVAQSSVELVDATGKATVVTVKESTKFFDAALNAITFNQLKVGEEVKVEETK